MVHDALSVLTVIGCGVIAGVLFAVALSVLPALSAMPPNRYVEAHQLIGRHWDPTMPLIVLSTMSLDIVLAVMSTGSARWLFAVSAVLLAGVSVVSHFCNVPINRQVKILDPDAMPLDWTDPRPLWRKFHALRTVLSFLALITQALAVIGN